MKKLFFVAALAFAALTVNAQGVYHAVAINGTDTTVATPNIPNLDVAIIDGAGEWTVKGSVTETAKVNVNGVDFTNGYIQGSTNGMVAGLDKEGTTSAHIQLTPDVAGTVNVVAKYGKNKPIWAAKVPAADVEDLDFAAMSDYLIEGFSVDKDNLLYINPEANHTLVATAGEADTYDYLPLAVEPGYTYFFWVSGSKLMLVGLLFEAGEPQAIENNAAAVKATKVVENGQLVIIKNGVRFNTVGARL